MRGDDPNLEYLLVVAGDLGDLRDEVVFVGGSVAGLLLTDPLAEGVRATKDVDAIVEAATLGSHPALENYLPGLLADESRAGVVLSRIRNVVG